MKNKYIIKNKKPKEVDFIRLPKHSLDITNKTAFFLYVWLTNHINEFKMNEYFIKRGTGMDYRTFRKYLGILQLYGKIKVSIDTNSTDTDSICTIIEIVPILINKNK